MFFKGKLEHRFWWNFASVQCVRETLVGLFDVIHLLEINGSSLKSAWEPLWTLLCALFTGQRVHWFRWQYFFRLEIKWMALKTYLIKCDLVCFSRGNSCTDYHDCFHCSCMRRLWFNFNCHKTYENKIVAYQNHAL